MFALLQISRLAEIVWTKLFGASRKARTQNQNKASGVKLLPVRFARAAPLKFPLIGVSELLQVTTCRVKLHTVISLDVVKSTQDAKVLVVLFRQIPQLFEKML